MRLNRGFRDHGPFNSWDRIPYITKRANGTFGATPIPHQVRQNFIINGYNGVWALDHDDGSSHYNDTANFLVYGGCKNFRGNNKRCGPDNVIIHPGIDGRSSGNRACQTNDNVGFDFNEYVGNQCVTNDGQFYTFSGSPLDKTEVPFTANNTFYSPKATFVCKDLNSLSTWNPRLGPSPVDHFHIPLIFKLPPTAAAAAAAQHPPSAPAHRLAYSLVLPLRAVLAPSQMATPTAWRLCNGLGSTSGRP